MDNPRFGITGIPICIGARESQSSAILLRELHGTPYGHGHDS
jgi:hypothetical protein